MARGMLGQVSLLLSVWLLIAPTSHAQNPDSEAESKPAPLVKAEDELLKKLQFSVRKLNPPQYWKNAIKIPMKVTTKNKTARLFARQGFGLLQNQWDFEAHRSFVEALNHDEKCLVAYTGLLMLSKEPHNPSHSSFFELVNRVDDLKKLRNEKGEYVYSKQERLYADIALAMAEKDQQDLYDSIDALVKAYPLDFQAHIMREILLAPRSGGNVWERKVKYLELMMRRYPYNPLLWVYMEQLYSYVKDPKIIKEKVLPSARNLAKWAPEMPIVRLKYAIFLQKSGNYVEAASVLQKALNLYEKWGKYSRLPENENIGIFNVKIYMVMNLYYSGKFDAAMKLANELQKSDANIHVVSRVRGIYLWDVQTLPARLYLARRAKGDLIKARDSLPDKKFCARIEDISAAPIYYKSLREYIGFEMCIKDNKIEEAEALKLLLDETNDQFREIQQNVVKNFIDRNYFYRGKVALRVYHNVVQAKLEKIQENRKGYKDFMEAAQQAVNLHASLSILPPQVIETIAVEK